MRKLWRLGISSAIVAISLGTAAGASAGTEFGSNCQVNVRMPESTLVQIAADPEDALGVAAPVSGIVTSWNVHSANPATFIEKLQIFRPTGNPNEFTAVGESPEQVLVDGPNSFPARIPIHAGDHLGIAAGSVYSSALSCAAGPKPGDVGGSLPGVPTVPLGSTRTFVVPGFQVGVSAVIEPDADNDGFGDETQDQCPQSAAFQTPCPTVTLDGYPIVKKGSVLVLVSSSSAVPVTVTGSVKLGKGNLAHLVGGVQTILPGKIATFALQFPNKLRAKLKKLKRRKSLRLEVQASATDVIGRASSDTLQVRLKGQK